MDPRPTPKASTAGFFTGDLEKIKRLMGDTHGPAWIRRNEGHEHFDGTGWYVTRKVSKAEVKR
jgi:hypothetical protein